MPTSIHTLSDSRVSAKSLAIDLLSTMPRRVPVPVGALVRGGAVLGIGENSMRVAIARLRARGLVESDERGLYRLSRAAEPVNREVRAWRSSEAGVGPWDGSWLAVESSRLSRGDRKRAHQRTRALRLLGFETLTPSLRIRPDNLVGGVDGVRRRLVSLGYAPDPLIFKLSQLDPDSEARARSLWDTAALEARYGALRAELVASIERLPRISPEDAMAETFLLGGEAVRHIVLDPLLPEPIVDTDARRALVEEMKRYDRVGRDCWKDWAGESIGLERSPADVGGLAVAATPA
jgi:phenylacetic acid degradation operon negative regulatory protein